MWPYQNATSELLFFREPARTPTAEHSNKLIRVPAEFIVPMTSLEQGTLEWCRYHTLWNTSDTDRPYGTNEVLQSIHSVRRKWASKFSTFIPYVLLRVCNKAFHLETDMFSCLSATALNETAKDVFCDAVHRTYQSVACFQNAIGYHSTRPNVPGQSNENIKSAIKIRTTARLSCKIQKWYSWFEERPTGGSTILHRKMKSLCTFSVQ